MDISLPSKCRGKPPLKACVINCYMSPTNVKSAQSPHIADEFYSIIRKNSIIRKILFYVIIQSKRHLEQMKLYTWVVWLLFNTWPT